MNPAYRWGHWRLSLAIAALVVAAPASAYVPLTLDFVDGVAVEARWPSAAFPLPLTVSQGLSSDIQGSSELSALTSAMNTWSAVSASAASLALSGEAQVEAGLIDGINAIDFSDAPELEFESSIALTFLLTDTDGTVLEADILVNDRRFGFNIDVGNLGLDLETTLLHELGHLLGLDHSAVGTIEAGQVAAIDEESAVMYPIPRGPGETARVLRDDDTAAIVALYPSGASRGAISGRIARNGEPVFGAHVLAFEPTDQLLVGVLSLPDGSYRIGGLPPGRYVLRVQPLTDSRVDSRSFGGIFSGGVEQVNTGFLGTFLAKAVDVQAGSEVGGVNVEVR